MGTAAEEAGWTLLLPPLLFFTLSATLLILLSRQSISFRFMYTPFQKRLLLLMVVWSAIRTLAFFFRSLVSLVPYLADSPEFITATRVFLSIGGAPLTRVVTKNCLSAFVGIKIFPDSKNRWLRAWNNSIPLRKRIASRAQILLDMILLAAVILLVVSAIAHKVREESDARWQFLVKLAAVSVFTCLNLLPVGGAVFALVWCECDGGIAFLASRVLKQVLIITLIQSSLLVIKYAYTVAESTDPERFGTHELFFYSLSALPEFLMASPLCLDSVVAMFRLDAADEAIAGDDPNFIVVTEVLGQAAFAAIL
ncbi:hypothetical protein HDU77_002081 [Chytriomyces hyalinus]|nr:hypothetical protein HDU77_002081 [Chytriomyces hyalinus]